MMIKTVLFDVDGVILSEERYFDASALTVWEMLHSEHYLGLPGDAFAAAPEEAVIRRVREEVFARDEVLSFIKGRGINSNWDMVFLAFGYQLVRLGRHLLDTDASTVRDIFAAQIDRKALQRLRDLARSSQIPFPIDYPAFVSDFSRSPLVKSELLLHLNTLVREYLDVETELFSRNSELWQLCQETFQEWYLGDLLVQDSIGRPTAQPGKKGFLEDEIPLVDPAELRDILLVLRERGYALGIGTGRPTIETHVPLKALQLLDLFEANRVVTATHVLQAEEAYPELAPLAKPHPYCYLKGISGLATADATVLQTPLPLENGGEILIVGDSLADLLAARAIGCRFAATLTGLTGLEARAKFEEEKADYILNDVSEILTILP